MRETHVINYGFGREYLSNWGINEALREIYQNYIDYSDTYTQRIGDKDGMSVVSLHNDYVPTKLEFLRIGNSDKQGNPQAIGKHGEGLKMAFLIFLRLGYRIKIITSEFVLYPDFIVDPNVGELFIIKYQKVQGTIRHFITEFECPTEDLVAFLNNIISEKDIVFTYDHYGSIVNKTNGNIYVGKLFVCHLKNMKAAYNLLPSEIPLDRDRAMPRVFDVNWATSQIQEKYAKFTANDTTYNDFEYIQNVPEQFVKTIKPTLIGGKIEFLSKEGRKETLITNSNVKSAIQKHSFIRDAIAKIKRKFAKNKSPYELVLEFKNKYSFTNEQLTDLNIILKQLNPKHTSNG